MKIQVIKIGKPTTPESRTLVERYHKRCKVFNPVDSIELKDWDRQKLRTHKIGESGHHLIALDERGKEWTSPDFAKKLQSWADDPAIKSLSFLIGGPYGLDEQTRKEANGIWSLSRATLPSDLAWILTWEQIYRAFTILKGMPYHHG